MEDEHYYELWERISKLEDIVENLITKVSMLIKNVENHLQSYTSCLRCQGKGYIDVFNVIIHSRNRCPDCNGEGQIKEYQHRKMHILYITTAPQ